MPRVLVFQHIQREHPSIIADYAKARGAALDVIELWREDAAIPEAEGYDALVVLGGPMGVYEDYPNKRAEIAAITEALGKVPVLGICLGAQLLAHVLGGRVYQWEHSGKRCKEIGYYDVTLTEDGARDVIFAGFPHTFQVLQWHGDTFDLPAHAALLATGPGCPNQAFSYKNAYGLQFHVEATPEIVDDWVREDATWTHEGFEMDDEKVLADARALAKTMKEYCYRLMDNFLSL